MKKYPLNFPTFYFLVVHDNNNKSKDPERIDILLNVYKDKGVVSKYISGENKINQSIIDNLFVEYRVNALNTKKSNKALFHDLIEDLDLIHITNRAICLTSLLDNGILLLDPVYKCELQGKIGDNSDPVDVLALFYEYALAHGENKKLLNDDKENLKSYLNDHISNSSNNAQETAYENKCLEIKNTNPMAYGVLLLILLYSAKYDSDMISTEELVSFANEYLKNDVDCPILYSEEILSQLHHLAYLGGINLIPNVKNTESIESTKNKGGVENTIEDPCVTIQVKHHITLYEIEAKLDSFFKW